MDGEGRVSGVRSSEFEHNLAFAQLHELEQVIYHVSVSIFLCIN